MNNNIINDRKKDLLSIVEDLDITPTMFSNAVNKYNSITSVLKGKGIDAHIYPQGSFAIGTVVKPKVRKRKAEYDLDVVCEVNYNKSSISPAELYEELKNALESDGRYTSKMEYYDECITINYSEINNVGFSIDIVPSVHEDQKTIQSMKARSTKPTLCDTSIAITTNKALDWGSSNPKGFQVWFENENQRFIDCGVNTNVEKLLSENRAVYTSVDRIPKTLIKTPLQRVIQLMKIHNNEFFNNPQINKYKVKSVIIATLVTTVAAGAPAYYNTFELLEFILDRLTNYNKLHENHVLFRSEHPLETLIQYDGTHWFIENPSNPNDNLGNSWNDDSKNAKYFFIWLNALIQDYKSLNNENNTVGMINFFGESTLSKTDIGKKYIPQKSAPIKIEAQNKPWRENE